jgi:NAD(P)-dependent dehydrogenase (short-subunit alcohol dehydrogenase family)
MAQVTITQLPNASALTGAESVPIVQNGQTVQTTTGAIAGAGALNYPFLTVSQTAGLTQSRYLSTNGGLTLTDNGIQNTLQVNLIGAVNVAHAFAPRLIERGGGSILFLVSVAGQIGSQTDPPYSASKAALINFTQCAAKDLGPHNVRVNALAPGMVKTELNQSIWAAGQAKLPEEQRVGFDEWAAEKIKKVSHLGRWQMPDEYAAMATFLASEHAKNITGQTINIDGGWVMHS